MTQDLLARLDDCSDELEKIKTRINKDQFDDMVKFLQRYAIIKACGTIEYVVKNMIADHVDAESSSELQNYISVKVRESSTNPTTGNISNLLGEFSSTGWKKSFDNALTSHNEEKTSLNSLVQLRNDFAHGKSPTIGIISVIKYFNHARTIVSLVETALSVT
jgi:hypothetical protein